MGNGPPMAPFAKGTHKWRRTSKFLFVGTAIIAGVLFSEGIRRLSCDFGRTCVRDWEQKRPTAGWVSSAGGGLFGGGGHPTYTLGYVGTWDDDGEPCECRVRVTERRYEREMYGE